MRSFSTPRRWALASFCTSALCASASGAAAGDAPPRPAQVAAIALELPLARRPEVYLVLDPTSRQLDVKVRGVSLDRVSLAGIELVVHAPLLGGRPPSPPPLPTVWRVVEGPGDTDREYIAPAELRPYRPDGYDDAQPGAGARSGAPPPTATPLPEAPAAYRARLDNGWDLWITDRLPPQGFLPRAWAAVRDGLQRVRGRGSRLSPAIALAMAKEDAMRLHHLMRSGMAILVVAEP